MENPDSPPAPSAPTQPLRAQIALKDESPEAAAKAKAAAELAEADARLPTIREHVERKAMAPWQAAAIIARLHGEHVEEEDGAQKRVFPFGVDANTRMTVDEFDAAAQRALHGRV